MKDFKVNRLEERQTKEVSIDYNGSNYLMLFGGYTNGGFFVITNHGVSGELADSNDTFYNTESISRALEDVNAGPVLASVIKELGYND